MFRSHSNFAKQKLIDFTRDARKTGFDSKITSGEGNIKSSAASARSSNVGIGNKDQSGRDPKKNESQLMNTGALSGRNENNSRRKVT